MEQANGQRLYNGAKSGARDTHPAPLFRCCGAYSFVSPDETFLDSN